MSQITPDLMHRLTRPEGRVDAVLDTDTYNEIDDQFALGYLIKSDERISLKAIYAAPFFNEKSTDPADGMEKSYQEIHNILRLTGKTDLAANVYRGSQTYLPSENTPVISEAASHLASFAMNYTPQRPLYVIAIGAITNVASAILMNPQITERIVLIWLGGNAHHWPDNQEFNLMQDVAGARVVFGCGAALVQLPCMGVVSAFTTGEAELNAFLKGKNELCDYLAGLTIRQGRLDSPYACWSRAIWDVTAVGWLVGKNTPEAGQAPFMYDCLVPSPIPQYDHRYSFDPNRHMIRYVYHINRDALLADLFDRLTR